MRRAVKIRKLTIFLCYPTTKLIRLILQLPWRAQAPKHIIQKLDCLPGYSKIGHRRAVISYGQTERGDYSSLNTSLG